MRLCEATLLVRRTPVNEVSSLLSLLDEETMETERLSGSESARADLADSYSLWDKEGKPVAFFNLTMGPDGCLAWMKTTRYLRENRRHRALLDYMGPALHSAADACGRVYGVVRIKTGVTRMLDRVGARFVLPPPPTAFLLWELKA
jgi:hypothetical protein